MCGIYGAVALAEPFGRKDFDLFVELTNLVRYRGPDAGGYHVVSLREGAESSRERFDVFFGHRRLAIIDLDERSNQPMCDGADLVITFNGEIFNYVELTEELRRLGHNFRTGSDTEVILKLYREFGEDGFDRMNGMWAFALLDKRRHRLILSRDRFSMKPLYYTRTDRAIFFASEIKQLLPVAKERTVNQRTLATYLQQGLVDHSEETFFGGVYAVKPRHNAILNLRSGALRQAPYWDYSCDPDAFGSPAQVVEKFRALFEDSVRIRLRADVNVAALLSGGLDSSSIVSVASRFHAKLSTFSAIPSTAEFSEERYVDAFCGATGSPNTKVILDASKIVDRLAEATYHNDEPLTDLCPVAHYLLLETLRQESDAVVLLSGQGGDEILMGYLKYFFFYIAHLVRSGRPFAAAREVCHSILKRTAMSQFALSDARRYSRLVPCSRRPYILGSHDLEPIWAARDLRQRQIMDIERYSVPALNHYEDRTSMAHSQEIRLPFLDHRLVNFAISLPVEHKLHKGWSKYVLRQAMSELPEEIRWRRDKQWFSLPEREWLAHGLAPLIQRCFRSSVLDDLGVIDSNAFLDVYHRYRTGASSPPDAEVGRVFLAELWARTQFGELKPEEPAAVVSVKFCKMRSC
jgi:asparagine synthase (glutamine-hydrolysing)